MSETYTIRKTFRTGKGDILVPGDDAVVGEHLKEKEVAGLLADNIIKKKTGNAKENMSQAIKMKLKMAADQVSSYEKALKGMVAKVSPDNFNLQELRLIGEGAKLPGADRWKKDEAVSAISVWAELDLPQTDPLDGAGGSGGE